MKVLPCPSSSTRASGLFHIFKGLLWSVDDTQEDDDSQAGPDLKGFVFHVAELPGCHSRDSMVNMFHAITEWATQNPTAGEKPNLNSRDARNDLLGDSFYYPDTPDSYEDLRRMFENAFTTSVPPGIEHSGVLTPHKVAGESSKSFPGEEILIQLLDNSRGNDVTSQQELQPSHYDVFLNELSSCEAQSLSPRQEDEQLDTGNVLLPAESHLVNSSHTTPDIVISPETKNKAQKLLPITNRVSSRQQHTTQQYTQHLGAGLRPTRSPKSGKTVATADSTLPESLRIAKIEANARAIRRRPLPTRQEQGEANGKVARHDSTEVGKSGKLLQDLSLHRPVGIPLGKEEMDDLCPSTPAPDFLPYRHYNAYRAREVQNTINGAKDTDKATKLDLMATRTDLTSHKHPNCLKPGGQAVGKSQYPSPERPSISFRPKSSQGQTSELPHFAAGQELDGQRTLRHGTDDRGRSERQMTAGLVETLQSCPHSMPDVDSASDSCMEKKSPNLSFNRRLSRTTARRLLEAEPGIDFDNAFQDAKKASLDPAMRLRPTTCSSSNEKASCQKVGAVKTKVQFFEGITRTAVGVSAVGPDAASATEAATATATATATAMTTLTSPRLTQNQTQPKDKTPILKDKTATAEQGFSWPRFSDQEHIDPATEYAAKWRAKKRAKRKGMLFDRK